MNPDTLLTYSNAVHHYLDLEYESEVEFATRFDYPWQSRARLAQITLDCFMAGETPQMCCSLLANEIRVYLET